MKKFNYKVVFCLISFLYTSGCSTQGGFYSEADPQNNEFSIVNSILLPVAVAGVVVGAVLVGAAISESRGSGGGGYWEDPRWDFLRANSMWACRNARDGQFLETNKCATQPLIDNWPET